VRNSGQSTALNAIFCTVTEEADLANAVSRSGDAKEALGGPFLYVTTITAAILLFWRSNLTGIIAVATMAAGDGVSANELWLCEHDDARLAYLDESRMFCVM